MILATLGNEVRNLSNMFPTLQKFALKEDKLELKFHDQNLMTKRDLGFDHEYICEKLEIISGFNLASQKSIPNINQVFFLVLKLSWCYNWLYQMVWKDFWWYFIMFANSRNITKHHSCPLCHVARRAATRDRHVCRFQASFWMVPQVCCMVLSYASTVQRQVFLGHLLLRFPSGVQWRAVRVMASCSLLTFPWWWSPCCLDCSGRVAVGWRWCQAKRFAGFSWGSLFGRLTARICRSLRVGHLQQHHFCLLLADLQANSLCVSAESRRLFLDMLVSMGDQG